MPFILAITARETFHMDVLIDASTTTTKTTTAATITITTTAK